MEKFEDIGRYLENVAPNAYKTIQKLMVVLPKEGKEISDIIFGICPKDKKNLSQLTNEKILENLQDSSLVFSALTYVQGKTGDVKLDLVYNYDKTGKKSLMFVIYDFTVALNNKKETYSKRIVIPENDYNKLNKGGKEYKMQETYISTHIDEKFDHLTKVTSVICDNLANFEESSEIVEKKFANGLEVKRVYPSNLIERKIQAKIYESNMQRN